MKTKEQWIDETLESLDGIRSATGNPFICDKVMHRINHPETTRTLLQPRILWQMAAGLALLISINVFSVAVYNQVSTTDQSPVKTLATEYFSYIDTVNF